eukprot:6197161-Pleurochrysis_carterae.AAC.2
MTRVSPHVATASAPSLSRRVPSHEKGVWPRGTIAAIVRRRLGAEDRTTARFSTVFPRARAGSCSFCSN